MDELWRPRQLDSQFLTKAMMCLICQLVGFCWCSDVEGFSLLSFGDRVVGDPIRALSNWKSSYGHNNLWNIVETNCASNRRFLRAAASGSRNGEGGMPSVSPAPSPSMLPPSPFPSPKSKTPISSRFPMPDSTFNSPASSPSLSGSIPSSSKSKHNQAPIIFGAIGGFVVIATSVISIIFCRSNKVATVQPWASGLSGQLQKVFVTGVQKLQRSELEIACEDFSNVVGVSSIGTVYKGTLSNGVEIAVISIAVTSTKDWTKNHEAQFRKKISTLSKLNHKNFVNLLGYCEEDEPFTRMMIFEYAPNGTLFEHLHVKEAEHLDWATRLRIAMGVAYCLDHMHQLTPPMAHNNLNSSVINLTEDYAAKISDFSFGNGLAEAEPGSAGFHLLDTQLAMPESNVYSFGLILFEMVTCRLPDGSVNYWRGHQPLKEILDPTLDSVQEEQLERIGEVIKCCLQHDSIQRPTMSEVTAILREITAIGPDRAIPKLSPLWWAELEILSVEAS